MWNFESTVVNEKSGVYYRTPSPTPDFQGLFYAYTTDVNNVNNKMAFSNIKIKKYKKHFQWSTSEFSACSARPFYKYAEWGECIDGKQSRVYTCENKSGISSRSVTCIDNLGVQSDVENCLEQKPSEYQECM